MPASNIEWAFALFGAGFGCMLFYWIGPRLPLANHKHSLLPYVRPLMPIASIAFMLTGAFFWDMMVLDGSSQHCRNLRPEYTGSDPYQNRQGLCVYDDGQYRKARQS